MTGIHDPDRTVRIVVDGHPLRVSRQPGSPDRVPLLLLMGIAGRYELWDPLQAELARHDGPSTIAFDVPGVGGSPTPRFPLRLARIASLTVALLDRLDVARVDVLGMSWGGLLAQELAVAAPTRVRRLVLANTNLGIGSIPPCPLPRPRQPRNLEKRSTGSPPWPRSALWSRGTLYQYLVAAAICSHLSSSGVELSQ